MGKKKGKKAQMFQNFLAFKAGGKNVYYTNNTPVNTSGWIPTSSTFQTPHSDQESLTELLDDNSPNVSSVSEIAPNIRSGSVQPSGSGPTPTQQAGKWTALKPVEEASSSKIRVRQDLEDIFPDIAKPIVAVVEGSASKIQLVIDKLKKANVQAAPDPPNPAEDITETNPEVSIATNTETATTNQGSGIRVSSFASMPVETIVTETSRSAGKSGPIWVPNKKSLKVSSWTPNPVKPGVPNTGLGWPKSMGGQVWNQPSPPPKIKSQPQANYGQTHANYGQPQANYSQTQASVQLPVYETIEVNDPEVPVDLPQAYSPSDVYSEAVNNDEMATDEDMQSPEAQPGEKRVSAFQRLGPVQPAEKKPKLTINLLCNQDVREVLDETDECPTHLRTELTSSEDPIVVKYLDVWPWRKNVAPVRVATARASKSAMIMEQEYLEEAYMRDNRFIQVSATGYPPSYTKEDVLDAIMDSVKGKSLIPCFIEFSKAQCKFLVIRSRSALLAIHKYGFVIRLDKDEIVLTIANIHLNLNQLDFVPRLILRKIMATRVDGKQLDLSEFTTKPDISHFVYFPLRRVFCQTELMQLQSTVPWETLTHLDLSRNKITTLTGFGLFHSTPRLRHLDLSHNNIEKATMLMQIKNLPLKSIVLEGNPLCTDYIEQEHYIKVLTLLFSGLEEIDGVQIKPKHDLPDSKRNYCCEEAKNIVSKLLEVMFPLLDASQDQRFLIEDLYRDDAVLTVTFMYKLHYSPIYKEYRSLFARARVTDEGNMDSVEGGTAIAKLVNRWPNLLHDPDTFTVDVLYHSDTTTILRIGGIVKITAETLAEEEYLLAFTRTVVLYSRDGAQYKITNEMLYWDLPAHDYAETAFKITRMRPKNLNLRLDAPPDGDLKNKLLGIFMQITELEKKPSERCLEARDWHIRNALEYFSTMLKIGDLDPIMKDKNAD